MASRSPAAAPRLVASVSLPFTSSAAPAVGDLDGDGRPDVVVTSDHIGDVTRERTDARNVNALAAFTWRGGALRPLPGWPRRLRDAALGLALGDLDGDGRDDVVASCAQDFADPVMEAAGYWLVSRLYVFRGDGMPMPRWFPAERDSLVGQIAGHAYAPPVIAEVAGRRLILQSSQGAWESGAFRRGGMRMWAADGGLAGYTGMPGRFGVGDGFSMDVPPVLASFERGSQAVVAASNDGSLYAWTEDGRAVSGWLPSPGAQTRTGAAVRSPVSAGDLDGDGRDEILAGSYDGVLRCWNADGSLRWQTSSTKSPSPITSGIALGRMRDGAVFIAMGDASGAVSVWDARGRALWRGMTTSGSPVMAEPAIGDVDGDGDQDVVVGGTDGLVVAWDARTGKRLWAVPTVPSPTTGGQRLEGVFGAPALADLRGDGSLCVIVATGGRYVVDVPSRQWQGFGHLLVYDCGRGAGRAAAHWPQFRAGKFRAGRLATPRYRGRKP